MYKYLINYNIMNNITETKAILSLRSNHVLQKLSHKSLVIKALFRHSKVALEGLGIVTLTMHHGSFFSGPAFCLRPIYTSLRHSRSRAQKLGAR